MKFTSSLEKVKRDGGAHSAGRKPLALKKTVAERAGGGHNGPIALNTRPYNKVTCTEAHTS